MFKSFNNIAHLLNKELKAETFFLFFLIFFTVLIETLSIGLIFPLISLLADNKFYFEYKNILDPVAIFSPFKYLKPNNIFLNNEQLLIFSGAITIFCLVYILKSIYLIFFNMFKNNFIKNFHSYLTKKFISGYMSLPYKFYYKKNYSDIIRNTVYEVTTIVSATDFYLILISEIFILVGLITLVAFINPLATILCVFLFGTSSFLFHFFTKKKLFDFGEIRKNFEQKRLDSIRQMLGGIKELKIYGVEKNFIESFNNSSNKVFVQNKWTSLFGVLPKIYLELLLVLIFSSLIFMFILENKSQAYIFSTLSVFGAVAFRLLPSVNKIIGSLQKIKYYDPAITNLTQEYIEIQKGTEKIKNDKKLNFKNIIKLSNITFAYDNTSKKVLDRLNLSINKNSTIGLVGESGAGKTTLVNILTGLLQVTSGDILVDNEKCKDNKINLNCKVGYVPQDIFLTNESIKKNVAFGLKENQIDESKVLRSLNKAQLENTIENLPQKIETRVGERGIKFSGGQLQRIGIARALYNEPDLLILDEPTSSLDRKTEEQFIEVVKKFQ